jgi:hypothetical protein
MRYRRERRTIVAGWKELEAAIVAAKSNGLPLKFDVEFKPYRLDATLPVANPLDKVCPIM